MTSAQRPIRDHSRIGSMSEYLRLYRESLDDPEEFWRRQSELLTWFHPPQNILDCEKHNSNHGKDRHELAPFRVHRFDERVAHSHGAAAFRFGTPASLPEAEGNHNS